MSERAETIASRDLKIKKVLPVLNGGANTKRGGLHYAFKHLARAVGGEKSVCAHCKFLEISDKGHISCFMGHDLTEMYNDDHYLWGEEIKCGDRKDLENI